MKPRRFEAEWVTKQHRDSSGEWNPDRDEHAHSHHATREEAESAAIAGAKLSGIEWILVAEQEQLRREWVDINRWTGDFDGLNDLTLGGGA